MSALKVENNNYLLICAISLNYIKVYTRLYININVFVRN